MTTDQKYGAMFFALIIITIIFVYSVMHSLFFLLLLKKCEKLFFNEQLEIITKTRLPDSIPKVVWIYTTCNDFDEKCVLRGIQQTYKNFEIWISDGSNDDGVIKTINNFAKRHKINVFRVGNDGSKSKSDNLNRFLKYSGVNFDYLLITDADEILHPKFVDVGIRFFYSDRFKNLGYVSSIQYLFGDGTMFSNKLKYIDQINEIQQLYSNIRPHIMPALKSASCLIPKKMIYEMGNSFPPGKCEDISAQNFAYRNNYGAMITNLAPCGQTFDNNFSIHKKRFLRVNIETINKIKVDPFKGINNKYSVWLKWQLELMILILLPFTIMIFISIIIYMLVSNWGFFVKIPHILWFSISFILMLILISILRGYRMSKFFRGFDSTLFTIMLILYGIAIFPYLFYIFFRTMIKPKSIEWVTKKQHIKNMWLLKIFLLIMLIGILFILNFFFPYDRHNLLLVIVFLNVFLGSFALSIVCGFILDLLSIIPCKRTQVNMSSFKYEKIKNSFNKKNPSSVII